MHLAELDGMVDTSILWPWAEIITCVRISLGPILVSIISVCNLWHITGYMYMVSTYCSLVLVNFIYITGTEAMIWLPCARDSGEATLKNIGEYSMWSKETIKPLPNDGCHMVT